MNYTLLAIVSVALFGYFIEKWRGRVQLRDMVILQVNEYFADRYEELEKLKQENDGDDINDITSYMKYGGKQEELYQFFRYLGDEVFEVRDIAGTSGDG